MAENHQFEKQIRDDAETFLARIVEVERIIEDVTPASTLDESTALAVMERLDDIECLKFAAWCVSQSPEELSGFLAELDIPPDKIETITAFAGKYSTYDLFLTRLNRTNQGYENELTRLSSRPSIQTFGRNVIVTLRLYNHDRLLLASSNGLDGLIDLISMLIVTASDTVDSVNSLAPQLLRKALDADDVSEILKKAEMLRQIGERLKPETEQSS